MRDKRSNYSLSLVGIGIGPAEGGQFEAAQACEVLARAQALHLTDREFILARDGQEIGRLSCSEEGYWKVRNTA
jgi:hypothetical protein